MRVEARVACSTIIGPAARNGRHWRTSRRRWWSRIRRSRRHAAGRRQRMAVLRTCRNPRHWNVSIHGPTSVKGVTALERFVIGIHPRRRRDRNASRTCGDATKRRCLLRRRVHAPFITVRRWRSAVHRRNRIKSCS